MKKKRAKKRVRIVHSTRKSFWYDYESQKKRLGHCLRRYETEARKVAEILGL